MSESKVCLGIFRTRRRFAVMRSIQHFYTFIR
jgi:hypothetical protein